jgi:S-formylglutathione hydrolase FrmB
MERLAAESAINRVQKLKGMNKPIIVSCGYDDFYVRCTDLFSQKCRYMGIPHVALLTPGKHSWPYWGYALTEHLAFFTKLLNGENLGY